MAGIEDARQRVRDLVGADIDVEVIATDPWQAQMLLADSYGAGRLHIIGDAAHQNPPWGGHGFNTGVGDAINLAWKIAAVLQGWGGAELVASYQSERRPVAQRVIDIANSNMSTLSTDLSDPGLLGEGDELAEALSRSARAVHQTKTEEFHSLGLVLGSGYTDQARTQAVSVSEYQPGVVAGARLPHHRLADGGSLFDVLGRGFTVLGSPDAVGPLVAEGERRGVPVEAVEERGEDWPDVVLVRPDQVIAWAGSSAEASMADQVWERALRGF